MSPIAQRNDDERRANDRRTRVHWRARIRRRATPDGTTARPPIRIAARRGSSRLHHGDDDEAGQEAQLLPPAPRADLAGGDLLVLIGQRRRFRACISTTSWATSARSTRRHHPDPWRHATAAAPTTGKPLNILVLGSDDGNNVETVADDLADGTWTPGAAPQRHDHPGAHPGRPEVRADRLDPA